MVCVPSRSQLFTFKQRPKLFEGYCILISTHAHIRTQLCTPTHPPKCTQGGACEETTSCSAVELLPLEYHYEFSDSVAHEDV